MELEEFKQSCSTEEIEIVVQKHLIDGDNRGDARIWISGLNNLASPNDLIAIVLKGREIYVLNISQLDIEELDKKGTIFYNNILE